MNICIFGSGAIGSYIGALLMKSGIKVSLICRGDHLKAIQNNGLLMQSAETNNEYFCKPLATDDPKTLEKQDNQTVFYFPIRNTAARDLESISPFRGTKPSEGAIA